MGLTAGDQAWAWVWARARARIVSRLTKTFCLQIIQLSVTHFCFQVKVQQLHQLGRTVCMRVCVCVWVEGGQAH